MSAVLQRVGGSAGPRLLFIHGFGADRLSWLAVAPPLGDVAEVYTVDLPAHGEACDPQGTPSPLDMAEAVRAALAGLEAPVFLVGHSLGGMVAHLLHQMDPARFPLLALIAPAGFGTPADPAFLSGFATLRAPDTARGFLEQMVAKPRHVSPAMVSHVLAGLAARPERRAALARIAAALIRLPPLPPGDLPGDCLILWGAEDRIAPPPPGFAGALLSGVGHVPQIEAAAAVQRALRAALASQNP